MDTPVRSPLADELRSIADAIDRVLPHPPQGELEAEFARLWLLLGKLRDRIAPAAREARQMETEGRETAPGGDSAADTETAVLVSARARQETLPIAQRIIAHPYTLRVRLDYRADQELLESLCQDLAALAPRLRGVPLVDKDLVAAMFDAVSMSRNIAERLAYEVRAETDDAIRAAKSEDEWAVREAWLKLNSLVRDCLNL